MSITIFHFCLDTAPGAGDNLNRQSEQFDAPLALPETPSQTARPTQADTNRQPTRQAPPETNRKAPKQREEQKVAPPKEVDDSKVEPNFIPGLEFINDHPSEKPPPTKEPPPKKLTKAEIKRLQWEKERGIIILLS